MVEHLKIWIHKREWPEGLHGNAVQSPFGFQQEHILERIMMVFNL